jgi:CSLREA domain-containing protein
MRLVAALAGTFGAAMLAPGSALGATISVGVTNDEINADADCSLREAVQAANTNAANTTGCTDGEAGPAVDTIALVPGGSYGRTIDPDGTPDDNQDGDVDVFSFAGGPVVIQGGTPRATISGGGEDRVLDQNGGELTLSGVTVTDGSLDDPLASGAGIRSISAGGSLTLVNSVVADNNTAQASGGGILGAGAVSVLNSVVTENTAGVSGGGISQGSGSLTITDSTIGPNHAGADPGAGAPKGGGVVVSADAVEITDSIFDGNTVAGNNASGGGLALIISSSGTKTIRDSTFTANDAGQLGGGIFASFNSDSASFALEDSRIEGNDAGPGLDPSVQGGGLSLARGHLDLARSVVRDNDATSDSGGAEGGGLDVSDDASATIDDSAVVGNHVISSSFGTRGGGISTDGSLLVRRTTIASNELDGNAAGGDRGAGLYAGPNSAGVNAYNVTVHGNLALDAGSGGGGIQVDGAGSFVNLASSTVASNFAGGPVEPGDALTEGVAGNLISARNSIIDGPVAGRVCEGTISSGGNNVTRDTSCGLTGIGDIQNANPMLDPLADNGGLVAGPPGDTEVVGTRALLPGSPAIDHVPLAAVSTPSCTGQTSAPLATDARAFPRPFGEACDAGAYELTKCFGTIVGTDAIVGTEGKDKLEGTAGSDLLFGLAGNDAMKGKAGKDRLCGSGGKDKIKGGDGKDKLDGGAQKDVCKGGPGHDKATRCERKGGIP